LPNQLFHPTAFFNAALFNFSGLVKKLSIACNIVLLNKFLIIIGIRFSVRHRCSGRTGEKPRRYVTSKYLQIMKCIFCQKEKPQSVEHIIPESVGGSIIINNVCRKCNSIFGSEVDNKLIKNRHIYDAYHNLHSNYDFNFKFEFIDAYYYIKERQKISASKISTEDKTLVSNIGKNQFILDYNDTKFLTDYIRAKGKKKNLSVSIIDNAISKYLKWQNDYSSSKVYEDNLFEFWTEKNIEKVRYNNLMDAETPHRFIAKSCVEFAYLFNIEDKIQNLDIIRKHALNGNQINLLKFYQEIQKEIKPIPFHVIIFESSQFIIGLFAQVYFGVELNWVHNSPAQLRFANNILKKKLVYCTEENNRLKSTDREYVNLGLHNIFNK